MRARLHECGVAMRTGAVVTRIEPGGVAGDDRDGEPFAVAADGVVLVDPARLLGRALPRARTAVARGLFRIGDCVAPRLIAEAIFDGHRLAREIDGDDPEVALPYLRERVGDSAELPQAPPLPPLAVLPPRAAPRRRTCEAVDDVAAAAGRIHELLRSAGAGAVVAIGAGAAADRGRLLAERHGARFAVSRPQVEAGRATRAELVGASGASVAPGLYVALGISGALPHLVGMSDSATVVAVNSDRSARIFEHADLGVTADAAAVIEALLALAPPA